MQQGGEEVCSGEECADWRAVRCISGEIPLTGGTGKRERGGQGKRWCKWKEGERNRGREIVVRFLESCRHICSYMMSLMPLSAVGLDRSQEPHRLPLCGLSFLRCLFLLAFPCFIFVSLFSPVGNCALLQRKWSHGKSSVFHVALFIRLWPKSNFSLHSKSSWNSKQVWDLILSIKNWLDHEKVCIWQVVEGERFKNGR